MLFSTIAQVGFVALVAVTLITCLIGRRWARLSAGLQALNWIAVSLLQDRSGPRVFQLGDLLADSVGAVLATWLAIASRRGWAAAIAAFQVLGVANRLVALLGVSHRASVTTSYVWEAGALVSLVIGAWLERQEDRRPHLRTSRPPAI